MSTREKIAVKILLFVASVLAPAWADEIKTIATSISVWVKEAS